MESPTNIVRVVRLQRESESLTAEWSRLLKMKGDTDLLVIRKDENIDYHKGVLHDVTEDAVSFDLDGEVLPVKRSKVFGFAYHHRAEDRVAAGRVPHHRRRRLAVVGAIGHAGRRQLQWTTPAGLSVTQPVDKIVQIDFSSGQDRLSERPEARTASRGRRSSARPSRRRRWNSSTRRGTTATSRPPLCNSAARNTARAWRCTAARRWSIACRNGFSRFRAMAGIDDAVRPDGKVRLVIRGDDKVLLDAVDRRQRSAPADRPRHRRASAG